MKPSEILRGEGVLDEARHLITVEGYTLPEAAHALRKKYNPLENEKKKNMTTALSKLIGKENLKINFEARSKNIFLVGKSAQKVLKTYNKWYGTNYSLLDFYSYTKAPKKPAVVTLKDGTAIKGVVSREIRKILNTRLLTYMNFGNSDLSKQVCPASGLPFVYDLDIFETKKSVKGASTYDLHHMAVSKNGESEIKNGENPSKIVLEKDLFDQKNIEELTEFFGMIMLSPSGHKGIHSEYSNSVHNIDDYKVSKRPWAIRSEKNYLKFFKEFGLQPKYTFKELSEILGFSLEKLKKPRSKMSIEDQRIKKEISEVFSKYNTIENYSRPVRVVYEEAVDELVRLGYGDKKMMKMTSFGSFRRIRAKKFGWN
jgi:hypothetical protein